MSTEPAAVSVATRRPSRLLRPTLVVGLVVLSPYCAEFLIAYQGVPDPAELLIGLLFLAPLYGTVAVLVRELARRAGRGWPTILLLCAAFGLIQAGLIDQSLFQHGAVDQQSLATRIPGVGISASQLLAFVVGHVVWSFAAPIAVVEACAPRLADRPWLGWKGTAAMVVLYLAAAALFVHELVVVPGLRISPLLLAGTAVVVAVLMVAAFVLPARSAPSSVRAPQPWLVGGTAVLLLPTYLLVSDMWGWSGVVLGALALALLGGLVLLWSGRAGWGREHVLAGAGAALVVYAVLAFVVDPEGASLAAKYVSSTVALAAVLALLAWARHRVRTAD